MLLFSNYFLILFLGDLKTRILELTLLPICRQVLVGWRDDIGEFTNATPLHSLNINMETELIVTDLNEDDLIIPHLNDTFTLNIKKEPDGENISLNFPGKQTYLEVKTDVYTITDIPVRHQEWIGWPPNITNQTRLAESGIDLVHNFVLKNSSGQSTAATTSTEPQSNVIEIDSSDSSEFEDATDFNTEEDLFTEPIVRNRLNYLSKFWIIPIDFLC